MNSLYDYIKKLYENKKIVQSFLIGNVLLKDIKTELILSINEFIFNNPNSNKINTDTYILDTENGIISKDDINNLINTISTTSQFNNKKVYIINECEKLNEYAYNSILKTLEEPGDNIYAFLITSNLSMVKETISSRCQKIFISSGTENNFIDDAIIDISNSIIDYIENYDENKTFDYNCIENNIMLVSILNYIMKHYMSIINDKEQILNNNEYISYVNKILKINENIIRINNRNLNKNLSIDRFLIEMCGVK